MTTHAPSQQVEDIRAFIETRLLGGRTIGPDEDLLLSGLLDSLAVMSLVAEVERVTARPVPPTDVVIENFATLDAIANYMSAKEAN